MLNLGQERTAMPFLPPSGAGLSAASAARLVRSALIRNHTAAASVLVLGIMVAAAVAAPWVAPYSPVAVSHSPLVAPGFHHLMGTDQLGRDIFSRVIWGGRPVLGESALGVAIAALLGVSMGLVAGYSRGPLSFVVMRTVDVLLAFPGILTALVVVTVIGSGLVNVAIAIGISFLPAFARVVYGSTLAAKGQDYVLAARSIGCRSTRILLRHIGPNIAPQIVVLASSALGWAVLTAATLSFLGFGLAPPAADWGSDLSAGQQWVSSAWWIPTFPGLAITVVIVAANHLGDFLNERLSPRRRVPNSSL